MKAPMGISWHIGGQPGLALLAAVARGTTAGGSGQPHR